LPDDSGSTRDYFLGKECIGEYMYKERGIAQVPTSEVCIIFSGEDSSLLKKFVNHDNDVIQAGEMTVPRKGFDGSYANWTSLRFVHSWRTGRPLTTAEAIIEATLAGEPMVGRTTLALGEAEAILEYPIPYMNVHPPDGRFQVDVGPILYPGKSGDDAWMVQRFQLSYVMYNDFDSAEFALRVPTPVADGEGETLHYSQVVKTAARHEIFGLET
jgi:hypothetical protein